MKVILNVALTFDFFDLLSIFFAEDLIMSNHKNFLMSTPLNGLSKSPTLRTNKLERLSLVNLF
jgi:hypothetical protein